MTSALYVPPGSAGRIVAEGLAWLWRLGPVIDAPAPGAVGLGGDLESDRLRALVRERGLAGAILFVSGTGAPGRFVTTGVARFPGGERVRGKFTLFEGGEPAVTSSLGTHAVRDGPTLLLGIDVASWWGRLEYFWVLEALEAFLPGVLGRAPVKLPPIGVVRLDDAPGTAQHQMQGNAKPDSRQMSRLRSLRLAYGKEGACLNTAVAAEGLKDGQRVPLDEVWPGSIAQLRAGVGDGSFEPVCHGLLHLVPEKMERGEVDWFEFRELDRKEAGRRIDKAREWQAAKLGRAPATFVAPAWGYSEGTLAAAAERNLPAWMPPEPGPLMDGPNLRETLDPALRGIYKLDYRPLARWARAGMPPTLVFHGGMFDLRIDLLRPAHDYVTLARLLFKRDIFRIPGIAGVRWVGTGEYAELLREHDAR